MSHEQNAVQRLYRKLLSLYPRVFRERLGESMQQTFDDFYNERKRQTEQRVFGFVLWMFLDTAIGIFREHRMLISPGDRMQTIRKNLGSSALISFLLILPFMIMEVVNRRNFTEGFPVFLFCFMWLNLFAIGLILLPIVRGKRTVDHDKANPVPAPGNPLLTDPRSAAMISVILVLSIAIIAWLGSLGWDPLDRLVNGPNPEQLYVPGLFVSLGLFSLPVAAGIIASGPVVRTLRAGGSLFAHPINLIIVILVLSAFAIGLASLIIDQWPCFIGVPNCD